MPLLDRRRREMVWRGWDRRRNRPLEMLLPIPAAGLPRFSKRIDPRLPDQPADPDFRRIVRRLFDIEKTIDEILPVKIADPVEQTRGGRQLQDDALIAHKHERDFRMPGRLKMKLVLDIAALCVFRA